MTQRDGVLIRGGRVVDQRIDERADVLVLGGVVQAVGDGLDVPRGVQVVQADNCVVCPGLVDLHTHLREPGREDAETVASGARAAALGGYTAVVAMPNTNPPIDSAQMVREVLELGKQSCVQVAVAGTITKGRRGESLAPLYEMAEAGAVMFTDDGNGVQDAGLMRLAMEYAGPLGVPLAEHCEDESLARGGQVHEGAVSSRLGLPGQPAEAEEAMVARDIALSRLTGAKLHLMHLSTAGSVALLGHAKADGLPVSAEATPHHLCLTDEHLARFDPLYKVKPPLRPAAHVQAVREALAAGVIDAVATDHAPHGIQDKEVAFEEAAFGMTGLESALSVVLTELVLSGRMPLREALSRMSWQPAAIASLAGQGRPVAPGEPGNLCVFDPEEVFVLDSAHLGSKSRNSPFLGRKLQGRVRHTLVGGRLVVKDGEVLQ